MRKIFIILSTLLLNISFLYAEENTEKNKPSINIPAKKEKVVIYYFQDKSKSDKYRIFILDNSGFYSQGY